MQITTILIDDENAALKGLERLLYNYPDITISGLYNDAFLGIEKIKEIKPELVFLDINMPMLGGIDAASIIYSISPNTDIIFVTAYNGYATEAFELHAFDYLLKPIIPSRLNKAIEYIRNKKTVNVYPKVQNLKIRFFGKCHIILNDNTPIKWRTDKTKELFAYLLSNAGLNLSKDKLLDTLWRDDNCEKSIKQLYNNIYYIRAGLFIVDAE